VESQDLKMCEYSELRNLPLQMRMDGGGLKKSGNEKRKKEVSDSSTYATQDLSPNITRARAWARERLLASSSLLLIHRPLHIDEVTKLSLQQERLGESGIPL
jgi:hypothetical protein